MAYFMVLANRFLELLGIPVENIRFKEKLEGERAHYAIQTFDQEVKLSRWGWIEVSGHANRTDYDLSAHIKMSGKDLYAYRSLDKPKKVEVIEVRALPEKIKEDYGDKIGLIMSRLAEMGEELLRDEIIKNGFVEVEGIRLDKKYFSIDRVVRNVSVESFVPHVIEPSFGLDRICYAVLEYAYKEVGDRVVLSLPPYVAPYDAAVFPLLNNKEFVEKAVEVRELLVSNGYRVFFDVGESIGRRYARADEIGVPAAFTIDHQTFKDNTVTVRDRDSWRQYRISIDMINKFVEMLLGGEVFDTIANNLGLEPFTS
jgi:glycyl-tRNA synthetase